MLQRSPGIVAGDRREGDRSRSRRFLASTEPRHRGRGSECAGVISGVAASGFNGAPASWPGIDGRSSLLTLLRTGLQRSPGIVAGDRTKVGSLGRKVVSLQRSPGIVAGDRPASEGEADATVE